MSRSNRNIHDKFFKQVLSDIDNSKDFLNVFLPEEISKSLDLNTLKHSNTSFVSDKLKESFSDVIFKCNLKDYNKDIYISILIEHKSFPDKFTAVQVARYINNGYVSQIKTQKKLTPILATVFYHGKESWQMKSISELMEDLPAEIKEYIPSFKINFIELNHFSDNQLMEIGNTFLRASLFLQKYSYSPENLEKKINKIFGTLFPGTRWNLLNSLFVYYLELTEMDENKFINYIENIPSPIKENFMSTYELIAQKYKREGRQEGRQEGFRQSLTDVIIRGWKKGATLDFLADITGMNVEEIKKIIKENKTN